MEFCVDSTGGTKTIGGLGVWMSLSVQAHVLEAPGTRRACGAPPDPIRRHASASSGSRLPVGLSGRRGSSHPSGGACEYLFSSSLCVARPSIERSCD